MGTTYLLLWVDLQSFFDTQEHFLPLAINYKAGRSHTAQVIKLLSRLSVSLPSTKTPQYLRPQKRPSRSFWVYGLLDWSRHAIISAAIVHIAAYGYENPSRCHASTGSVAPGSIPSFQLRLQGFWYSIVIIDALWEQKMPSEQSSSGSRWLGVISTNASGAVVGAQPRCHLRRSSLHRCVTALRPEWIVEDLNSRLYMLCCTTAVARPGGSPWLDRFEVHLLIYRAFERLFHFWTLSGIVDQFGIRP